jgi:hypothetical protein
MYLEKGRKVMPAQKMERWVQPVRTEWVESTRGRRGQPGGHGEGESGVV